MTNDTKTTAAPPLTDREAELVKAIFAVERAAVELRRADAAGTQPRMQKAGNRYYFAHNRLYLLAWKVANGRR